MKLLNPEVGLLVICGLALVAKCIHLNKTIFAVSIPLDKTGINAWH